MVLRRSESAKTTLSMYTTRRTKYQKWLGIVNVTILLGSLCLIFFGMILKLTYFMDQLQDIVDWQFATMPWYLMSVGILTFLIATMGFIVSSTEERPQVFVYACLTVGLVVLQFGAVFLATDVRRMIDRGTIRETTTSAVTDYNNRDPYIREKWDYLQTRMRCCGAWGHTDYTGNPNAENYKCVPNTCCWTARKTQQTQTTTTLTTDQNLCGAFEESTRKCETEAKLVKKIYTRGCLDIMKQLYEEDLRDLMLVFAVGGVLLALAELVGVSLAFAFCAQMSRKMKRETDWQAGGEDVTRGGGGGGLQMNDFPQDN